MIILWCAVIIVGILSIVLLSGKGSFLIAGYNTLNKKEKSYYNEKLISRIVGIGMLIIAISLGVLASYGKNPPEALWVSVMVIAVLISLVSVILVNTIGVSKQTQTKHSKTVRSRSIIITTIGSIALLISFMFTFYGGSIKVSLDSKQINIDSTFWKDDDVLIDQINDVTYTDDFDTGSRVVGRGGPKLYEGKYKNNEFGNYTLYVYGKTKGFIIIETTDRMVVINAETPEKTQQLFEQIKDIVNK